MVHDNSKNGFVHPDVDLVRQEMRLPDERTGTFMVFKTFDRMSYGLIMEATDVIRVGGSTSKTPEACAGPAQICDVEADCVARGRASRAR